MGYQKLTKLTPESRQDRQLRIQRSAILRQRERIDQLEKQVARLVDDMREVGNFMSGHTRYHSGQQLHANN